MSLSRAQLRILRSISKLEPDQAYGANLTTMTGINLATLYFELERLQKAHYVDSKEVPGGQTRGFRNKIIWSLKPLGERALCEVTNI